MPLSNCYLGVVHLNGQRGVVYLGKFPYTYFFFNSMCGWELVEFISTYNGQYVPINLARIKNWS